MAWNETIYWVERGGTHTDLFYDGRKSFWDEEVGVFVRKLYDLGALRVWADVRGRTDYGTGLMEWAVGVRMDLPADLEICQSVLAVCESLFADCCFSSAPNGEHVSNSESFWGASPSEETAYVAICRCECQTTLHR